MGNAPSEKEVPVTKGQVPQPASLRVGRNAEPKQLRLGDTHSHEESYIFIKQILMFMSPEQWRKCHKQFYT